MCGLLDEPIAPKEYAKTDVRAMAGGSKQQPPPPSRLGGAQSVRSDDPTSSPPYRFDLPTQARKDSQGICFLGKLKWDDFLGHYIDDAPGDVCELDTGKSVANTHQRIDRRTDGRTNQ